MQLLNKYKLFQLLLPFCISRMTILKSKQCFRIGYILNFELLNFTKLIKKSHCGGPGGSNFKIHLKAHVIR